MNDQQVIEQAYSEQLHALFDAFLLACGRNEDETAAEVQFKIGLAFLRAKRDKAIAIL